ncbi:hypothetical protein SteCoe_31603 [Stentor coeruleus]|uniref:Uncharacterized protein n=1 Tax=Stentor coeruleus TaxID=5963 RepID=A0A1R2B0Y2_9CILI|nr:hypothetical protein SteCoe_31603 [Stentor coeruleus]
MVGVKLSKKLQLITISPLIMGIIVCAVISVVIMFKEHIDWLKDSRSNLIENEMTHLNSNSVSFSESFSVLIDTIALNLMFLSQIYQGVYTGEIKKSKDTLKNIIKFEESYNFDIQASVWYSIKTIDFGNIEEPTKTSIEVTNNFMISIYEVLMMFIKNIAQDDGTIQLGMILESGVDFRYPARNMTQTLVCHNSTYNPLFTKAYIEKNSKNINIYYECGVFTISISFLHGIFSCYLSSNMLNSLLLPSISGEFLKDYIFFIAPSDFSYIIMLFPEVQEYDNNLCNVLFPNDVKLIKECGKINGFAINETTNITITGYNSKIFASYSVITLSPSVATYSMHDNSSFTAGTLINKRIIIESWNNLIEKVINIIIIQMIIFIIFILITIAIAWKLSASITSRITFPISIIEKMLKNRATEEEINTKYNREVNKVIKNLELLNILEKFIDPHFLMHPDLQDRIENLKTAFKLFETMKNYRGMAITKNLIGNAHFLQKKYPPAQEAYTEALNFTIKLHEKLLKQETNEKQFNKSESYLLKLKTGKNHGWEEEKNFIKENIVERKQQLCMVLEAQIILDSEEILLSSRSKLKVINKYQAEILEYYVSTRSHYIRMIKILLDIAKIFQYLQYYHSGLQLLDIVRDELTKLRSDQTTEVDIDITRLKSIGINIKVEETASSTKHFNLGNILYEKDILLQHMHYRRGMILMESDKPQEASHALTSAIESGYYYDPEIRVLAVEALYKMMSEFGVIDSAKDLHDIYNTINSVKKSLLFVLIYDIKSETQINVALIRYLRDRIDKIETKIGVIIEEPYSAYKLDIIQRDMPGIDLENLFISIDRNHENISLYDTLIRAANEFQDDDTQKTVFAIVKARRSVVGAAHIENFNVYVDKKIKLIVIYQPEMLPSEFEDYVLENGIVAINLENYRDFNEILDEVSELK